MRDGYFSFWLSIQRHCTSTHVKYNKVDTINRSVVFSTGLKLISGAETFSIRSQKTGGDHFGQRKHSQ